MKYYMHQHTFYNITNFIKYEYTTCMSSPSTYILLSVSNIHHHSTTQLHDACLEDGSVVDDSFKREAREVQRQELVIIR